jgi:RNA polymerase sigma factor (sigma-70 family)
MSPVLSKAGKKRPPAAWTDQRLVKACLSGNEEAWSLLIDKYKALIYSIPVKYGLSRQEASDVFQATCTELLLRLPQLREPRALPKWLMQVAHHESYRWKRQSQRVVSRDDEETELPEPATPAIADNLVQQTQEEQMLREAVAALTPQCRRLVELLFFETPSRPYVEVAAELGLAVGSIGFTRQKCLERLREQLVQLGFD